MQEHDETRRDYLHDGDLFRQVDPEETELAFQLHNSHLPGEDTVERIVQRYSDALNKWISASLFYKSLTARTHYEMLSILKDVFVKALFNVSQFTGQASISTWLFSVSYPFLKSYKRKIEDNDQIAIEKQSLLEHSGTIKSLESLENLPENLWLPLLLRYLFGFELPEIALILRLQVKEVHRRLVKARNQLSGNVSDAHMVRQIQEYVDGLLDEDRLVPLQQHLAECEACQHLVGEITTFERTFTEELKERWDLPKQSDRDRDELVQLINREFKQPAVSMKHQFPWQQLAWIVGFVGLFIGLAFIFIRLTPVEREFPKAITTRTPQLPPLGDIHPTLTSLGNEPEIQGVPSYVYPALSSDGNWVVFTSIKYDPHSQSFLMPALDIFNRQTGEIRTIGDSTIKLKENTFANYLPSISGDGRIIVYASATDARGVSGMPCLTADGLPCTDIVIYYRYSGYPRRLTQGVLHEPADGDSIAPTISEDGDWVAFWSAASNLVPGKTEICQKMDQVSCMYLYLYNTYLGTIERLPLKQVAGWGFQVPRISLSGDGRYLGFTLAPTTLITKPSFGSDHFLDEHSSTFYFQGNTPLPQPFAGSEEAVIYDRETHEYELEDQAPDGTAGDGPSSSPVLSTDGRYVAFISSSANLVQGDDNHRNDVFVRDRENGKIELISQSTDGQQGKAHSGSYTGFNETGSVSISPDGRYVLFESISPDLAPMPANEYELMQSSSYSALYLRDRQTASTEVISVLPNGKFSSLPSISADGRWVTFNLSYNNCNKTPIVCWTAMLYDRQSGSLRNLTKYDQVASILPWTYAGDVVIPWRTQESNLIAFSANGRQIAFGGKDSQVRIYQLTVEGELIKGTVPILLDIGESEEFSTLAFSPGGEWFAAGTVNGKVYIWNLPEGKLSFVNHDQSSLVRKIVFSQAGDYVVISNFYDTGIYRISDNRLIKINRISYGIAIAYAIDVTPRGDLLATSRGDGSIWLQSLPSGIVIGRVHSAQLDVSSLSFSPDGSLLASRSIDKTIDVWQINTGASITPAIKLVSTIQSYGYAGPLAFSPDNRYLAAKTEGGEVVFWSLPDEELFITSPIYSQGVVYDMAFSPAGGRLAELLRNKIIVLSTP